MKKAFLILLLLIAASHVYAVENETDTTAQVEASGTEEQNATASSPDSKSSNDTTQDSQK